MQVRAVVVYEEARREVRIETALAVASLAVGPGDLSVFGESFFDRRPQAPPRLLDEEVSLNYQHTCLYCKCAYEAFHVVACVRISLTKI